MGFFPVIFILNLSEALLPRKLTILGLLFKASSSLKYSNKLPDVFQQLLLYSIKHWDYNIKMFCIIYMGITYFAYAISEWRITLMT